MSFMPFNLLKTLYQFESLQLITQFLLNLTFFGFSVKDFQTRIRLMRCESRGDLYPITTNQATSPSTFSALAPSLWHARLGHPGKLVFDSLRLNKFIECNQTRSLMFVTLVLLENMLSYRLFLLILVVSCLLILSIVIFGHLPFLALRVTDIMFCCWMITLIFCGHFHCLRSLNFFSHISIF